MQFRNEEIATLLKSGIDLTTGDNLLDESGLPITCDVAFAIFLEPRTEADPRWTASEHCINTAVRLFQPTPALAHCELLVPPIPSDEGERTQIATYQGKTSGWQTDRDDGYHFYLVENGNRWRAVPIFASNAAARIRNEADMEIGVEYSLARYLTSVRFGRWFSGWLSDARRVPGHCATLAARVIKNALSGSYSMKRNAAWYAPTTLYSELCEQAEYHGRGIGATSYSGMSEQTAHATEQLLRGPMTTDTVSSLGDQACMEAVRSLTMRACNALIGGDDMSIRLTQQQLATALLRWVLLREKTDSVTGSREREMVEVGQSVQPPLQEACV